MTLHIGSNIVKYRKESGVTQAELAEYLGVSPQAVSKWEQETSVPDIYLIPKIALFFNISIDTLFGTTDLNMSGLLVSKYTVQSNDKNYKEALDALHNILDINPENTEALKQLIQLEFNRSHEFLLKGESACQKLLTLADNESDKKRAMIQLIRAHAMLDRNDLIKEYRERFETTKSVDNFNYLLIALGNCCQHQEILCLGEDYLHTFSTSERLLIYPNLMEAAYVLNNTPYTQICFDFITAHSTDIHQIFNAWWLLWKSHKKIGNQVEATRCQKVLLSQLPKQGYNEYTLEKLHKQLTGDSPQIINVL